MYDAAKDFGLSLTEMSTSEPGDYTAIWDGESFVYQSEKGSSFLWDAAKLWWRYGFAPYRAVKLVKNAVGTFLRLYEEPYFPFRSLTQRAFELGLLRLTGVTGEEYLAENNVRFSVHALLLIEYVANLTVRLIRILRGTSCSRLRGSITPLIWATFTVSKPW